MPKTKEEVLIELEESLSRMSEEERKRPFIGCACAEGHVYSMQSLYEAMCDPNNEDGQAFLKSAVELSNLV